MHLLPLWKLAVLERILTESRQFVSDLRRSVEIFPCSLTAAAIAEACTKTILAEGVKAIEISRIHPKVS